jgi:hypothetical protein
MQTLVLHRDPVKRYYFDFDYETDDMVERNGAQRLRDAAFYMLTVLTSAVPISALFLAVLAVYQIKSFKAPSTTRVVGTGITSSTLDSASPGMTVLSSQQADSLPSTSILMHDWSTTSHPTTASRARITTRIFRTDASIHSMQDIIPREEAIAFGAGKLTPYSATKQGNFISQKQPTSTQRIITT